MPPTPLQILVADPSEHVRAHLVSLLALDTGQTVRGQCATPADLLEAVEAGEVDVALVGLGSTDGWLEAIGAVVLADPTLPVVVLGRTGSNDEIRAAMRAGGRAFLTKPVSSDELREAIKNVVLRRRPAVGAPAAAPRETGRLVAVVSARGGSGRSTIALNLAVAAAEAGVDAVVVDANPGFGDIATLAGVTHVERTLLDAAKSPDRVDEFLTPGPLGIGILAALAGPMDAERISTNELRTTLERLRERHDLVIVDTPGAVDDAHLAIVELADELLVTVVAEIAALKNTQAYLALLESAGLYRDHRTVLNREGEPGGLETSDFRTAFGPIDHIIAADTIRVTRAANRGIPVVVSDPESALAGAFAQIAAAIVGSAQRGTATVTSEPATRFGWLRGTKPAAPLLRADVIAAHSGRRNRPLLARAAAWSS